MFKSYLKIALRNLQRQKGYSFINIFGLATGMTACLLILLYVQDELRYDTFHEKANRIYRAGLDGTLNGTSFHSGTTAAPMAEALRTHFPEVESSTRVWATGQVLLRAGDNQFYEDGFIWVDSTFFEVFTFPLLQGDPATALTQPNTIVLTEAMAQKYFGRVDILGEQLRYDNHTDYTVTGVMADVPSNSSMRFSFVAAISSTDRSESPIWVSHFLTTYVLLRPDASAATLTDKLPQLVTQYVAPQVEQALGEPFEKVQASGLRWAYFLEPLSDLYLYSDAESGFNRKSDITYVYILSAIAVFILLIACINFMNLATARASNRAKEVGLRKVLGSERRQLIRQFLGESVLLACTAMVLALAFLLTILPFFNAIADKSLSLLAHPEAVLALVGIALVVGLLAGLYPALVLSSFQPAAVLKGQYRAGAKHKGMRSALVVVQFTIAIILLVGTGVVFQQLQYMQGKKLGFAQEQVVVLPIETQAARESYEAFRQQLLQNPNVLQVAATTAVPGRFFSDTVYRPEGAPQESVYSMITARVSADFVPTLGLDLAAGRNFSQDFASDATEAILINEAAVRDIGLTPEEAVGKQLAEVAANDDNSDHTRIIIGVVKDFHLASLHEEIRPLALSMNADSYQNVIVRVTPEHLTETLAFVQQQWEAFEPNHPYRYQFLDEDFGRLYQQDARLGNIVGYFTGLAFFIACLGLFGLASFITAQRTKEIGIRKVLGASVPGIIALLSKEFTRLVLVAMLLAFPVAYFMMDRWLQSFAYRMELGIVTFLGAAVVSLAIAWLTVGYQSIKAAMARPAKSLRSE